MFFLFFFVVALGFSIWLWLFLVRKAETEKRKEDLGSSAADMAARWNALADPSRGTEYDIDVVGEAHRNDDGTERQNIIAGMRVGDEVLLLREPRNPYDPNAVAICTRSMQQIGYLSRANAKVLAKRLDAGAMAQARVRYIGGGTPGKSHRGVWLTVLLVPAPHRRKRAKSSSTTGGPAPAVN